MPLAERTSRDAVTSVVLDTDVASLSFKRQLPSKLVQHLINKRPFITFATLGNSPSGPINVTGHGGGGNG